MPAIAGSTEVWNGAEYEWFANSRGMLRTRAEIRSSDAFRNFIQFRGVVDGRWSLARHFSLVGQAQALEGKNKLHAWDESNRVLGGVELPFPKESVTLTSRSSWEHYFLSNGRSYDRFREKGSVRWTHVRFQPQLSGEAFIDNRGWAALRPSFGVLIPFTKRLALDAGYHFEFRPGRMGGNRQMIYTYFRFRRKG